MYYKILYGKLIQVSENQLYGYKPIIYDVKPTCDENHYVCENLVIENDEVHCHYEIREKEVYEDE